MGNASALWGKYELLNDSLDNAMEDSTAFKMLKDRLKCPSAARTLLGT